MKKAESPQGSPEKILEATLRAYNGLFSQAGGMDGAHKAILRGAMRISGGATGQLALSPQGQGAPVFYGSLDREASDEGLPGKILISMKSPFPGGQVPAGALTLANIPLNSSERHFGALSLQLAGADEQENQLRLSHLRQFSLAAASVLQSLEAASDLAAENTLLRDLSQSIHLLLMVGHAPGEAASLAVEEGLRISGCASGLLLFKNPENGVFEILGHKGMDAQVLEKYLESPLVEDGNSLAVQLLTKKEPVSPRDLEGHSALASLFPPGLRHFFCLPITQGEDLSGMLLMGGGEEVRSSREPLAAFLQLFADQAGLAVRNSLLYKQLLEKKKEFEAAAQSLVQSEKLAMAGKMSAAVAHQVRNPLSIIGANVQIMMSRLVEGDPWMEEFQVILHKIGEADQAIRDLLELSKPLSVKLELKDVEGVLKGIQHFVQPRCQSQKVGLKLAILPGLPPLWIDEMQLQSCILELCLNSLQALRAGNILVLAAAGFGSRVEIRVEDDGPGLQPQSLGRIFEPFYLAKAKGTGLGLYNVKRLCDAMGVTLEAANLRPRGTSFRLSIPAGKDRPAAIVSTALAEKAEGGFQG